MSIPHFKAAATVSALLAALAAIPLALAHAHLEEQSPAADSSVSAPKELRLTFSEGVEEKFSKVVVSLDGSGASTEVIALRTIATDPTNHKVLVATPATPLAPGKYTVEWHAVSVDTHKSEGTYHFTVTP